MKTIRFEELNKAITRKRGNVEDKTNLMTQLQEYVKKKRKT